MFNQREAIRLEELRLTGGKTSIGRRQSRSRAANRTCRPLVLNIASPDCLGVLSKNASPRIASRTHIKSRSLVKGGGKMRRFLTVLVTVAFVVPWGWWEAPKRPPIRRLRATMAPRWSLFSRWA
jgi:hypothetical protein